MLLNQEALCIMLSPLKVVVQQNIDPKLENTHKWLQMLELSEVARFIPH